MTTKAKLQVSIANAIGKADSSCFFEDYDKQAKAVITALDAKGFVVMAKDLPDEVWTQIAKEMRTGRVKPEEHVKDVVQVAMRLLALK